MKIVINIPKAFENHFNYDKFEDSLERIKFSILDGTSLCGNYEVETIDMLIKALKKSTKLPKGHGRLIDADTLKKDDEVTEWLSLNAVRTGKMLKKFSELFIKKIDATKTIIEADKESD